MESVKPQMSDQDIHFDTDLLIRALRYHIEETGLSAAAMLSHLEGSGIQATVPRSTWAAMTDEQRLSWLLKASRTTARGVSAFTSARRPWNERQNI